MKFGIGLSNTGPMAQRENMLTMAKLAQELKFDSIWVGDHVCMPYEFDPLYPSANRRPGLKPSDNLFDPLVTLAFMAGVIETPMLGIGVLVVPYRNPVVTAKMLATLDVLSGGRVILGVGVGWMREEFEALGASYQDRGSVTDEYIQVFKELCTVDEPNFQGKHYQVSNVAFHPKPMRKPHPPIWVGGNSLAALRRVVRLGDGWQPTNMDPETLAKKSATLGRLCREAGRDLESIDLTAWVSRVGFGDPARDGNGPIPALSGTPPTNAGYTTPI